MIVELPTTAVLIGTVANERPLARIPLASMRVQLGFPSPAEDFLDDELDLNELCVKNPAATYLFRAQGHSMVLAGVCDGDILVVDRSVTPQNGDLVLASWGNEGSVCKVLGGLPHRIELWSANPDFAPLRPPTDEQVELFAVVSVVRVIKRQGGASRVRPR